MKGEFLRYLSSLKDTLRRCGRQGTVALAVLSTFTAAAGASAQACPNGTISYIFVDNHSVFDTDEIYEGARFAWLYRLANTVHPETSQSFILDEILFAEGDCYDAGLLEESERLLRRHRFIAQVDVFGIRQPDDTWHVVIDTKDEWTTKVNVKVRLEDGFEVGGVDVTEENILGRGFLAGAFFRQREEKRDLGARFATPRLFGTRFDARLEGGRTRIGDFFLQELSYPFVGEVGHVAAREYFERRDDFFPYALGEEGLPERPDATFLLLPVRRKFVEVTVAARVGRPGNLTVFGLGMSDETLEFRGFPDALEIAGGGGFGEGDPAPESSRAIVEPQTLHGSVARVNLLFGQRNIRFVQRVGLDALRGVQDVQVGTDFGLTVGRSIGVLTSAVDDPASMYVRAFGFGGFATSALTGATQFSFEGQQILSGGRAGDGWRDMLVEFDALLYWQPAGMSRHTVVGRFSGAGGWEMTSPFQLTLGGAGSVRGFDGEAHPGAQRIVVSLEDRIYLGWPYRDLIDTGVTLFADAGRMWAGDVPFGTATGWKASVGAGLRFGFPAGTPGVVRMDVAYPLEAGAGLGDVVFRASLKNLLGLAAGLSDRQLDRSRLGSVGADRFTPGR